jgi:hypothetical protein
VGYNNERSTTAALVFDCEAVAIDGASAYLETASAPANYETPF